MGNRVRQVTVRSPATTANLGPGFDCLALALDLWNQVTFTLAGTGFQVEVSGLGAGKLPTDHHNLIARAVDNLFRQVGEPLPRGLKIQCLNRVPLGSGLGSSASAVMAGLVGANMLLGGPLSEAEILRMADGMEGHPDNVAAAQSGGLVLVTRDQTSFLVRCLAVAPLSLVVVVPQVHLPTRVARAALPTAVPLADAVFNIGRAGLVIEALRTGDLSLLGRAMEDRIHQPYRLKLIPGAEAAFAAARQAGAASVALSGAGPSVIAFAQYDLEEIGKAMVSAFTGAGVESTAIPLRIAERGVQVEVERD